MSILSQKQKIFGEIAAARTLIDGMPQLKISSSMPSINNNGNSIIFLTDLLKALVGYEALAQTVIDTLTYYLKDIEKEVKQALKLELKEIVSCGVNPTLPAFIKSNGQGVGVTVNKIDFTDLMRVDPNSNAGNLLYTDIKPNLIDSTDFNTFLYQTIQNKGSIEYWGGQTTNSPILSVQFKANDVNQILPNNTLLIKAAPQYDNKTLSQLNNDYIDSVSLFNTEKLIINIVDMIFGSISNFVNKTFKQLETEIKINHIIDKISHLDNNDIINNQNIDKIFGFSNTEKNIIEEKTKLKQKGISIIDTANNFKANVSVDSIKKLNSDIGSATSITAKKEAISNSLDRIGNQLTDASNAPSNQIISQVNNQSAEIKNSISQVNNSLLSFGNIKVDHKAIKLNFIQEIINNMIKAIVNTILSPKVVTIFLINFKIIYGPTATFSDPIDFLKKNKNLVNNITKRISGIIIKVLLKLAMKKISQLVAESTVKQMIDKNQSNVTQLLSLIGVSPEILRQIKGLL